jgi:uncharacterized protein YabN with tetrapyrrole methylase and pyrophosphatase domain
MTDIFILGTGIRFPDQITLEVLGALNECEKIFTLLTEDEISALPDKIAKKCESMWPRYRQDRRRDDNYAEVAAEILAATQERTPVGWLTRGNPRILDSVSQRLVTAGAQKELSVTVLPAVSSLDSVLIDVGYDPAGGLLVVEATAALIGRTQFMPEIAALILQPGVFGTFYPRLTEDRSDLDLRKLSDYLLDFYPADHSLALVASSSRRDSAPVTVWTTISTLADTDPNAVLRSTIFIPPARQPTTDRDFLEAVLNAR